MEKAKLFKSPIFFRNEKAISGKSEPKSVDFVYKQFKTKHEMEEL